MMNTDNNIKNEITKINWLADPEQRKIVMATMAAANISFEWIRPKIKSALIIDENTGLATCPVCERQFNVDDYDVDIQKRAHTSGLCKECISTYDILHIKMGSKAKASGKRLIVNGGQNAGERIRAAFKYAIDNKTISDEVLENMQNKIWTKEKLKISSYAFLKDVTGFSAEQIKFARIEDDAKGKARYASIIYEVNGHQYLMTNALFSKNLSTVKDTFTVLNLIPADYEI